MAGSKGRYSSCLVASKNCLEHVSYLSILLRLSDTQIYIYFTLLPVSISQSTLPVCFQIMSDTAMETWELLQQDITRLDILPVAYNQ